MVSTRIIKIKLFTLLVSQFFLCALLEARPAIKDHIEILKDTNELTQPIFYETKKANLFSIYIVGNSYFKTEKLKKKILAKLEKSDVSDKTLDQLAYQLKLVYRRSGFENADVKIQLKRNWILVQINEGKQVLVDQIDVEGGKYFSNKQLKEKVEEFLKSRLAKREDETKIDLKELDEILINSDWLKKSKSVQIFNGTSYLKKPWFVYDASLFAEVKSFLIDVYYQAGFLDTKVAGPKVILSPAGYFVRVSYRVIETEQIFINQIKLISDESVSIDGLIKTPLVKKGDPINGEKIEKQRILIEEAFTNIGYPFVKVETQIQFEEENPFAQVIFRAVLGDKVKINHIEILGNDLTHEDVIWHRFKIKTGDWYSLEKLLATRAELFQTDLFEEVDIYLDPTNIERVEKKLIVSVKERKRTTLEFGIGASFEDGPRVMNMLQHRNLFGLGIEFFSRLQLNYPALFYRIPFLYPSYLEKALEDRFDKVESWLRPFLYVEGKVIAGFLYPQILYVPVDADGSLDASLVREIRPAYNANKLALQFGLTTRLLSWVRTSPQLEVEYAKFDCPSKGVFEQGCGDRIYGIIHRLDAGTVNQLTLKWLMSIDRRDKPLNPRSGYEFESNIDLGFGNAHLKSHEDSNEQKREIGYFKLVFAFNTFLTVGQKIMWIMNAKLGGIYNFYSDNYVPLFKRFYLGGTSTIRGFSEDQILPADAFYLKNPEAISLGGHFFTLMRNEIRFPLYKEIDAGFFVDVGELLENPRYWRFDFLSIGVGAGIRYQTPVGPLLFDLGFRVYDGAQKLSSLFLERIGLHFSINY